jgi:hypothetical protein
LLTTNQPLTAENKETKANNLQLNSQNNRHQKKTQESIQTKEYIPKTQPQKAENQQLSNKNQNLLTTNQPLTAENKETKANNLQMKSQNVRHQKKT